MNRQTKIPLWAKKGLLVWVEVRDKQQIEVLEYLEGTISEADHDSNTMKVKMKDSENEKEVPGHLVHERLPEHKLVKDLADIPVLNDAELLKHLEIRYQKNLIHCFCGPTLIVVNPYKRVDHEESEETY